MSTAAFAIRPMRPGDLDEVMDLEPVLFGAQAWSRSTYEEELSLPTRRYVVVDLEGEVAGYAGIDLAPEATVMTVGVAPRHQRRGLGRALMGELLDYARQAGCRHVHLEVRADDNGAQALYASLGFIPLDLRRGYYGDGDAITMRLRLAGPGPVGSERSRR